MGLIFKSLDLPASETVRWKKFANRTQGNRAVAGTSPTRDEGLAPDNATLTDDPEPEGESTVKALTLVGHEVEFSAPDDDVYLLSMSMSGPVDVQPVFEAFATPGGTVLDVGANIGVTAVMSGYLVGDGRVVAMEPVPETFSH